MQTIEQKTFHLVFLKISDCAWEWTLLKDANVYMHGNGKREGGEAAKQLGVRHRFGKKEDASSKNTNIGNAQQVTNTMSGKTRHSKAPFAL